MKASLSYVTVSELNNYLKDLVYNDIFLRQLWVKGEISNYKLHSSGHIYFTLKDENGIVRCVFFRNKQRNNAINLHDGQNVFVRGSISIYEKLSCYQLYVEEVQLDGIGDLYQAFHQLKEKLQRQGLFEESRKKPLPYFPRRVAVVTSLSGAALKDFLKTLERRLPLLYILIVPVAVQGREAPAQIREALEWINKKGTFDVVVLTRGGGSLEEIWPFNTEEVALAIYNMNVPVISAIGHETDFTISDFVADIRASTPTAAAEIIAPSREEIKQLLCQMQDSLVRIKKNRITLFRALLDKYNPLHFYSYLSERIRREKQYLDEFEERLEQAIYTRLRWKNNTLSSIKQQLENLDPKAILNRGFIYALDTNNRLVTSIEGANKGERLQLVMRDGYLIARVEEKIRKEKKDGRDDKTTGPKF